MAVNWKKVGQIAGIIATILAAIATILYIGYEMGTGQKAGEIAVLDRQKSNVEQQKELLERQNEQLAKQKREAEEDLATVKEQLASSRNPEIAAGGSSSSTRSTSPASTPLVASIPRSGVWSVQLVPGQKVDIIPGNRVLTLKEIARDGGALYARIGLQSPVTSAERTLYQGESGELAELPVKLVAIDAATAKLDITVR